VTEGALIHKVAPVFPAAARSAHVNGSVTMHATIGKDGTVQKVQVLKGNPLLVRAATDAVKQWRYRPYFLDGQPVETETNITINFKGE
jgi:protein TonB